MTRVPSHGSRRPHLLRALLASAALALGLVTLLSPASPAGAACAPKQTRFTGGVWRVDPSRLPPEGGLAREIGFRADCNGPLQVALTVPAGYGTATWGPFTVQEPANANGAFVAYVNPGGTLLAKADFRYRMVSGQPQLRVDYVLLSGELTGRTVTNWFFFDASGAAPWPA